MTIERYLQLLRSTASREVMDSGPCDHVFSVNSLHDLLNKLWNARSKWYNIGLGLGLSADELDSIDQKKKEPGDCLREVLIEWLKKRNPRKSQLIEALRQPSVGYEQLADNLHIWVPANATQNDDHMESTSMTLEGAANTISDQRERVVELSDSELENLEYRITKDITEIHEKFATLQTQIRESLSSKGVCANKVAAHAIAYGIIPQTSDEKLKFLKHDTLEEVFSILSDHWSFLDYDLLKSVVKNYGNEDEESMIEEYQKQLELFCKRRVSEVPKGFIQKKSEYDLRDKVIIKMKCDHPRLKDIKDLKTKVCSAMGVEQPAKLQIVDVRLGCVEVIFLVSRHASYVFERPFTKQQWEAFQSASIVYLSYGALQLILVKPNFEAVITYIEKELECNNELLDKLVSAEQKKFTPSGQDFLLKMKASGWIAPDNLTPLYDLLERANRHDIVHKAKLEGLVHGDFAEFEEQEKDGQSNERSASSNQGSITEQSLLVKESMIAEICSPPAPTSLLEQLQESEEMLSQHLTEFNVKLQPAISTSHDQSITDMSVSGRLAKKDVHPMLSAVHQPPLRKTASTSGPESITRDKFPLSGGATNEKLSLSKFVSLYRKEIPIQVRVCKGFYGPNEDTSISEGDRFNVHFIKHTKIVTVEYDNGSRYHVPLNSAVQFGILYNPNNNLSDAMKGYRFETVADLLRMSTLPTVVFAWKAFQGSSAESSIAANEALIVKKVVSKRLNTKQQLKVFSLKENKKKVLNSNCAGNFSTRPRDVCLLLPEILKYLPDIFPCKAVLYNIDRFAADRSATSGGLSSRSGSMTKFGSASLVTMMHSSIETSIVATSALERDIAKAHLFDIRIDLDILVRVEHIADEDESHRLYEDATFIYEHFDPTKLYKNVAKSRDMQSQFYAIIQYGREREGINLEAPRIIDSITDERNSPLLFTERFRRRKSDRITIPKFQQVGSVSVTQSCRPRNKGDKGYEDVTTHPRFTGPVNKGMACGVRSVSDSNIAPTSSPESATSGKSFWSLAANLVIYPSSSSDHESVASIGSFSSRRSSSRRSSTRSINQ